MTFGKSLSTFSHVDRICQKTRDFFDKLAELVNSKWGLGYKSLRVIYKGVFVPVVTYPAAGWFDRTTQYQRNKLVMAQRYALMRIIGAYRTTSAESLTMVLGVMPIDLECAKAVAMYKVRKGIEVNIKGKIIPPRNPNIDRNTRQGKAFERAAKLAINEIMLDKWQQRWSASEKAIVTHKYLPNVG